MFANRQKFERTLGRVIVEELEQHGGLSSLYDRKRGAVNGTDRAPLALIMLSCVSGKRKASAINVLYKAHPETQPKL